MRANTENKIRVRGRITGYASRLPLLCGLEYRSRMPRADDGSLDERLGRVLSEGGDVRLAMLFGSRARGQARPDSDFDIAVLLEGDAARADRGRTVRELAARLGRVVSAALIDLVILNDAPALLRHRVLRDGRVLFQRGPEDRVRFAIQTIRDYQDGQVRREAFTRERVRRLKGGANDGGSRDLLEKARSVARIFDEAPRLP
jgi:predicted nucleotidyltransferase